MKSYFLGLGLHVWKLKEYILVGLINHLEGLLLYTAFQVV